jgi:hypothetical protein
MAPKKVAKPKAAGRDGGTVPEAGTPPRSVPERRYVDIDPWAMLLEGLTEEEPAERTRPKKK